MSSLSEHGSPMLISFLKAEQARIKVCYDLGLHQLLDNKQSSPTAAIVIRTLLAELLRAVLWSLSDEGTHPVYVTRLLYAVQRNVALIAPLFNTTVTSEPMLWNDVAPSVKPPQSESETNETNQENVLHQILNELEVLGDVVSLPRGYWLSAPLRVVSLPFLHQWILIGGRPSHLLPANVQAAIRYQEITRFLTRDPKYFDLQQVTQSEKEWCRLPIDTVQSWAGHILSEADVQPLEDFSLSALFYAPGIRFTSSMQYFRWITDSKALPDGRYLMRSHTRAYLSYYSIAQVQRGQVIATCPVDVCEGEVRRLLYGIDALMNRPTTVAATQADDIWSFSLQNELPRAEYRLFRALGQLHLPSDGRYYPHRWKIPEDYAPQAAQALVRLGIKLDGADTLLHQIERI